METLNPFGFCYLRWDTERFVDLLIFEPGGGVWRSETIREMQFCNFAKRAWHKTTAEIRKALGRLSAIVKDLGTCQQDH